LSSLTQHCARSIPLPSPDLKAGVILRTFAQAASCRAIWPK
jgi:hypothetical protein